MKREKEAKTSADQFLVAAEMQPRRYMSRLQRSLHAARQPGRMPK